MLNESIARVASNLKETALSLARHEDATEEINALLTMADALEEIGVGRNRPLTLEEVKQETGMCVSVFCEEYWDGFDVLFGQHILPVGIVDGKDLHYLEFGVEGSQVKCLKEYGVRWRCWRTKPTDSDRAAAKWDEAKD